MLRAGWTTVDLVWREGPSSFHARNPFPVGGVVEDPATGAAAAALGASCATLARWWRRRASPSGRARTSAGPAGCLPRFDAVDPGFVGQAVRIFGGRTAFILVDSRPWPAGIRDEDVARVRERAQIADVVLGTSR